MARRRGALTAEGLAVSDSTSGVRRCGIHRGWNQSRRDAKPPKGAFEIHTCEAQGGKMFNVSYDAFNTTLDDDVRVVGGPFWAVKQMIVNFTRTAFLFACWIRILTWLLEKLLAIPVVQQ